MPANRDRGWVEVPGEHAGDVSYTRAVKPKEVSATKGALEAAAALGVDLSTVTGTGAGGKITKGDVEAAAA